MHSGYMVYASSILAGGPYTKDSHHLLSCLGACMHFSVLFRAVPMEETGTVSIAQEIIYRNYHPQWGVSSSNKYFLFLTPKFIFFLQWQASGDPLETSGFSPMVIYSFLVHWVKRSLDFFLRRLFLGFFLSFFINYIAMLIFYLGGRSFNDNKNHH